jgi:AcrR family transcriptional regulator
MGRPQTISNEDMLAAARQVFLKHGVSGSTREIAQQAGISEAAIFKRFSTKAQLFMAAMTPPAPAIESIIAKASSAKSARAGLEQVAAGILDYFRLAIPTIMPLVAHPSFAAPQNFDTSPATTLLKVVSAYIADENKRGRLRTSDPYAVAATLIATLHSIALFELMGFHGGAMPKAGVRILVNALWEGLETKKRNGKGK